MDMLKVLIASDSFKGSASSKEVAASIERGIKKYRQDISINKYSIADGGEGTLETIIDQKNGRYIDLVVKGPLGEEIKTKYGVLGDIAIIEMAKSSGLDLVKEADRNPLYTTTFGVGQMINHALDLGCRKIYIGLGGSATNDGGAGMAQALGAKLLDMNKRELGLGAKNLQNLVSLDLSNFNPKVRDAEFIILSDVDNPLCGENGASHIFGPQKGASPEDVLLLDSILFNYGSLLEHIYNMPIIDKKGAGAAGGLGAGLMTFCHAKFSSGIETVIDLIGLEEEIKTSDLIITGEGNMDNQSTRGKAPIGISKLAKKYKLPVIAIVGGRSDDLSKVYEMGIDLVIDIVNRPMDLGYAMENTNKLLEIAGETAIRAYYLGR